MYDKTTIEKLLRLALCKAAADGEALNCIKQIRLAGGFDVVKTCFQSIVYHERTIEKVVYKEPAGPWYLDVVIGFGKKHKGETLGYVLKCDPGYVTWMKDKIDNPDDGFSIKEPLSSAVLCVFNNKKEKK